MYNRKWATIKILFFIASMFVDKEFKAELDKLTTSILYNSTIWEEHNNVIEGNSKPQ